MSSNYDILFVALVTQVQLWLLRSVVNMALALTNRIFQCHYCANNVEVNNSQCLMTLNWNGIEEQCKPEEILWHRGGMVIHRGKNCCKNCVVNYPSWATRQKNRADNEFHKWPGQICRCCTAVFTDLSIVAGVPLGPAPAEFAGPPPPPPLSMQMIMQTIRNLEAKVATLEAEAEDSEDVLQKMKYDMKDNAEYVAALELRVDTTERKISDLELANHAKTDAEERYVVALELKVKTMEQAITELQLLNHAKTDAKTDSQERNDEDYVKVKLDEQFIKSTDEPTGGICKVAIADDLDDDDIRHPHEMGRLHLTKDIGGWR